jgi:hypothetical protein
MLFRRSIFSIVMALSALSGGVLDGVTVEAVSLRFFTEKQLTTLGEYFGGNEYCGRRTYLRTVPGQKGSLYLVMDLDTKVSELPKDATVVVDYIRNSDGAVTTVNLPLSKAFGHMGKALYIGLSELTNPSEQLLAWRITFLDGAGYPLTHCESFLWKLPDDK